MKKCDKCLNGCGGARSDCGLLPAPKKARRRKAGDPPKPVEPSPPPPVVEPKVDGRSTRPGSYTPELGRLVLAHLADGKTLVGVGKMPGMPHRSTVRDWVNLDVDGFADKYARARAEGFDTLAEELIEIADRIDEAGRRIGYADMSGEEPSIPLKEEEDGAICVQRDKLRIDTRKWLLGKLASHKYGERLTLDGDLNRPKSVEDMTDDQIDALIATRLGEGKTSET